MRLFPAAQTNELPGDYTIRKARRALVLMIASPILGAVLALISVFIHQLDLLPQHLTAFLFSIGTLAVPVGLIAFGLIALFLRVEARYMPRLTPPLIMDRVSVALGMLITFLPALGILYVPIQSLITGGVRYKFPKEVVQRVADPYGYWQGIGFWSMGAMALAYLAVVYWRSRWSKLKTLKQ